MKNPKHGYALPARKKIENPESVLPKAYSYNWKEKMQKESIEKIINDLADLDAEKKRVGALIDLSDVLQRIGYTLEMTGEIDWNEPASIQFKWTESAGGGEVQLMDHFSAHRLQAEGAGNII